MFSKVQSMILGGFGVIVYSLKENKSWRVTHNYFYLEPMAGEFFIAGHNFQWNDGVFSLELTGIKPNGYRDLYFHAMAGTHMYKVSTEIMRNETLATRSYHGNDFEVSSQLNTIIFITDSLFIKNIL